jgi:hypothetical protein
MKKRSREIARKEALEERRAFREAMRARIRLIAQERKLPSVEIKWIGRLKHYDLMCFAKRHRVNLDWLLCGDLKGLLETVRGCPSRPQQPVLSPGAV